uniref:Reverse transcriptase domain-containing protein n=1 Tax=Tanacetum cinerariifolium TaxID=118510 RepID=A0A6L2JZ37_TANCI|nr:hypothetical protein [Tanacetum cinerariifolium]
MNVQNKINCLQEMLNLRNSNQDLHVDLYYPKGSDDYTEVISTIPVREINEFMKSSVDDLVPILRESKLTLDSPNLECSMPIDSPCTDVLGDALVDIDLPLGDPLDTLVTVDREIDLNPSRDIEELECLFADDPVPVPRVFDDPLGNYDSMSRLSETSDLFEELIAKIGLDDSILIRIDDKYYDSEGGILFFEQLLIEDTSSNVSPAFLPTESSSLVLPLPDPKQVCIRKVERFDPFFFLTQSGSIIWVMKTPSSGFHHMPLPHHAAYSPKVVMYRYYHPHLTSGDGFYHGPKIK